MNEEFFYATAGISEDLTRNGLYQFLYLACSASVVNRQGTLGMISSGKEISRYCFYMRKSSNLEKNVNLVFISEFSATIMKLYARVLHKTYNNIATGLTFQSCSERRRI